MLEKLTIDKKVLKYFDFGTVFVAVLIVLFGCINIYCATVKTDGNSYVKLQLTWLIVSLVVLYLIVLVDYNILANYATVIYILGVLLLVYNDLTSRAVNGAHSWIGIGSRAIQPSEFAKLAMIIMLAKKLDDMEGNINNLKNFFILTLYAAIPMGLIVIQPDMGMTMVCFFIVLGIYFIMGLNLKVIIGGLTSVALAVVLLWNSGLIQTYQKARLTIFLHPETDELGSGLQLTQSLIGIGSGHVLGSGAKFGSSAGLGFVSQFVPFSWTDFIFSVVGEKWGFIGGIFLLVMYSILLSKIVRIAKRSKDIFGTVVCIGIFSSFLFSIIQNIGMTIGVMPITGITLPFMSYGGSSILTNFIALALVVNIGMRKKKINF